MSITLFVPRRQIGPFNICERKPKPAGTPKYVVTKSGDTSVLKDFGRYSTAVRWIKQQLPREVPHVVIVTEGDHVVSVHSTIPLRYTTIEQFEGPDECLAIGACASSDATVNPVWVKERLHSIELHQAQEAQHP